MVRFLAIYFDNDWTYEQTVGNSGREIVHFQDFLGNVQIKIIIDSEII